MITAILIGLAIAGLTYLTYKLTIAALRMYRKRKNTQIILADLRDMIRQMPDKEKRKYSFEELNQISEKNVLSSLMKKMTSSSKNSLLAVRVWTQISKICLLIMMDS